MPSIYDLFETNESKEVKGVWFAFDPDPKAEGFLLARAGGSNKNYDMTLAAKMRPYSRLIQMNAKNPDQKTMEVIEKISLETFVEAVLLDWRNVKDKEGNEIPFSKENALELFTKMKSLWRDLLEQAQSTAPYKDAEDDNSKN